MINKANILKEISLIFILIIMFSAAVFAQNPVKQGNRLFKEKRYCEAIKLYDQYLKHYSNKKIFLKRGICNYYCNHLDEAIEDLNNALLLGSYDNDLFLYLAKSYNDKQEFENAIFYYKKYLSYIGNNAIKRKNIKNKIKRCANGIYMQYEDSDYFIENWGTEINTSFDEILPLQNTSDPKVFYFSSNRNNDSINSGKYQEYRVENNYGNWEKLNNIKYPVRANNNILLDFMNNGKRAIIFSGTNFYTGSIYFSDYLSGEEMQNFSEIKSTLNTKKGFKYVQMVNDSTYIFSSNNYGGYGGYDLFITGKRKGKWFTPINLGPNINSSYDEISPFITKDCLTLYFSSNNLNSIGGFDIFKSDFSYSENDWMKPDNIGLPANSSANDYGFRLLSSGKGGIYNSDRKDTGNGKNDIYWIYFKKQVQIADSLKEEIPFLKYRDLNFDKTIISENKPVKSKKPLIPDKSLLEKTSKTDTLNEKSKPESQKTIKKEDFIIPYVFVKNNKFRDNNKTKDFIDKLAKLMILYPEIKVEFIGNSFTWEKDNSELPNSVKIAEDLADSLKTRMISPERMIIKGAGENIPAAKPNGPLVSKNIIKKINNRIDIYVLDADTLPYNFINENLFISKSLEDPAYKLYKAVVSGLTYRTQIYKSDSLSTNDIQIKYPDSSIEKDPVSNKYIYTTGLFKEYAQAKEFYKKLLNENIKNIKIIPYINDVKISSDKALYYAKQYLDLVNYLEDNKKYLNNGNK